MSGNHALASHQTEEARRSHPAEPRLEEVADQVFAYVQPDGGWCVNNAGIIVADGQSAVIDTAATARRAHALRVAALRVSAAAPRYVINTHSHGDHTFGNFVFPEAVVVGHSGTRAEIEQFGLHLTGLWPDVEWGDIRVSPPTLTYEDRLTLHLGELSVELRNMGTAHTRNDTVVWLPEQRVLFTGDLAMSAATLFFPMGSLAGSLAAVRELRTLRPEKVVTGHGPVTGPEVLDEAERYLLWVRSLAEEGRAAGLSPREVVEETDFEPWTHLLDPERLLPNLHRAYLELAGEAPGSPVDMTVLFQEMVEFRGGMPECHA